MSNSHSSSPILETIDKSEIVGRDSARTDPGNLIFAEFGGTAQPAVPTCAPRLRAAFRWFRSGMDLGPDPSAGPSAQLDFRFPNMPSAETTGGRDQLRALCIRRHAPLAALQ